MRTLVGIIFLVAPFVVHSQGPNHWQRPVGGWISAKWNTPATKYRQARIAIEAEIEDSRDPERIVSKYREQASGSAAHDPFKQFQWGVAWLQATAVDKALVRVGATIEGALLNAPFPGNVEYARLCFMVLAMATGPDRRMQKAGEKLAEIYPEDWRLLALLGYLYTPFLDEFDKILGLAQRVVQLAPQRHTGYDLYIFAYYYRWLVLTKGNDRVQNAKLALKYCGLSLGKVPKDEDERRWVMDKIGILQKWLNSQKQGA